LAEQSPDERALLGLTVYPRGNVELVYRNGIEPLMRGWDEMVADKTIAVPQSTKQGLGTLAGLYMSYWLTNVLGSYLLGEKPDSNGEKQWDTKSTYGFSSDPTMGWSPLNPGVAKIVGKDNYFIRLGKLASAATRMDGEDFGKEMSKTTDEVLFFFAPVATDVANWSRANGDFIGAKNWQSIASNFDSKYDQSGTAYRTLAEKIHLSLFGTDRIHNDKDFYERVIDSTSPISEKLREAMED